MSQLSEAKKRMFMRSSSIAQAQQQQNQIQIFTRNKSNKTNFVVYPNQFDTSSISKNRAHHQNWVKKDYSPQFAKTDRWGQLSLDGRFESKSQKPNQLNLFGQKKRRGTLHSRNYQPMSPTIKDVSFTEQDESVYNQSPIKELKETVHKQKLNLVLSKQPERKFFSPIKPRECIFEEIQKIVKEEKAKNENFTDSMFPPKFSIIYNKRYMYLDEGVKFERLNKFYQRQKINLIKFCQPSYLLIGKYTSYAVFSALSILSQEPALLLNLFKNQQVSQNGIYYVNLCKDGVWRYIIIDDYVPIKTSLKRNMMCLSSISQNNTCQIWAPLVEKALAKMYGTYQDLYLTSCLGIKQIFDNLTGFPLSEYTINKDFRAFLVLVDSALKKQHIVVLESIKQEYLETAMIKKLDSGLSFKVIEVKKTYILLRNLSQRQITTKLTFEEAMIFNKLLIFRCQKNYVYMSRTLRHKIGYYSAITFKVDKTIKCYWSLKQNSEVYYKNHIGSKIEYEKSPYIMMLQKQLKQDESQTQREYISGNLQIEAGKQIELKQGIYTLLIHLCQKKQLDFTVVFFGEKQLSNFERVRCKKKWQLNCQCQVDLD